MHNPTRFNKQLVFSIILIGLLLTSGLIALFFMFQIRSDIQDVWLFGYSRNRILLGGGFVFILLVLGLVELCCFIRPLWWRRLIQQLDKYLLSRNNLFWLFSFLYTLLVVIVVPLAVFSQTPAVRNLSVFQTIQERFGSVILWGVLALIVMSIIVFQSYSKVINGKHVLAASKLSLWIIPFCVIYIYSLRVANVYSYRNPFEDSFELPLIFISAYLLLWGGLSRVFVKKNKSFEKFNDIFLALSVFIVTFVVYQHYAYLLGWLETPRKAYWHLLADAFLNGKLYIAFPTETHDLTLYLGHWYLPNPPLPAFLMIPYVLLVGLQNVNTVYFSIFFSSTNSTIVFLILDQLRKKKWIKLSRQSLFWLVILFAFGTPHFWVGVNGMEWFVSQIVAVSFMALAVLFVLMGRSPWLVGLCLGLAMASRPNLFVIWPLLFFIAVQIDRDENRVTKWNWLIKWTVKSAVPIAAVVLGLLFYNYLRFDNPLDFGYIKVNGATLIIENARKYGLFNLHFVPSNLFLMFLKLPSFRLSTPFLLPSIDGMSMIVTTPALVFLVHKYEKKWWIIGAWGSVLLSIGLLSMYHNTGAGQFGFRYVLDFMIPLIMLLAFALGKKSTWVFRALVVISVIINGFGAWWFINYA